MGKRPYRDISGMRFGKLVAIERVGQDNTGKTTWLCQCDCGKQSVVTMLNLTASTGTRSCGCSKTKQSPNLINLIGKRFGKLVVMQRSNKVGERQAWWDCVCDCGNFTVVTSVHLIRNHTKSCGCLKHRRQDRHTIFGAGMWSRLIKQDGYCMKCQSTIRLNAHHILPVSVYKSLERDLSNGLVLCESCHKEYHGIYGHHSANISNLCEYLNLSKYHEDFLNLFVGYRTKGGMRQLKKARHYLNMLIEMEEKK